MKLIICLFFAITVFGQEKPIEIKIDSLSVLNSSESERKFVLHFHLTNLTNKPISFILNPKDLIPIGAGSLRPNVYYKLYENDTAIEANGILNGDSSIRYFKSEAEYTRYIDSVDTYIKSRTPEQLSQIKKEGFLEHIQNMEANQTKHFRSILVWDKRRYHRNDAIEYYIEEKEKHFIELHINLMTEELLSDFTAAEKKDVLSNKIFIKGWFTSNKMEIDLGE
ncbi:hypothetical protein [Flavobacterium sp. TBRC 19031]|uniref:hypothetical protein n=1 Tax=Flavobacterium mekongense TaxID=3379707 RepID=UPI003999532A